MTGSEMRSVLRRLAGAITTQTEEALREVMTEDIRWSFAYGPDLPHGRVFEGYAGILSGLAWQRQTFESLHLELDETLPLDADRFVMTGQVTATMHGGEAFRVRMMELVGMRGNRICLLDAFWKHPA